MASRYVSDSAAAKSLSCYVILKGGRYVATVTAHFGSAYNVLVNVFQRDAAQAKSAKAAEKLGVPFRQFDPEKSYAGQYSRNGNLESALHGLFIDGHLLTDHCAGRIKPPKDTGYFPASYKPPRGYSMANYGRYRAEKSDTGFLVRVYSNDERLESDICGYSDCFKDAGLRYLEKLGYEVIQGV